MPLHHAQSVSFPYALLITIAMHNYVTKFR